MMYDFRITCTACEAEFSTLMDAANHFADMVHELSTFFSGTDHTDYKGSFTIEIVKSLR